jgi:hypothetical protein
MHTFGALLFPIENIRAKQGVADFWAAASCPICLKPISAVLSFEKQYGIYNDMVAAVASFQKEPRTPETTGIKSVGIWPAAPKPEIPRHLPLDFNAKLLEAERSFAANINTGAAGLYRSLIDVTTKRQLVDANLNAGGSLKARIDKLAENHAIPKSVAEWAHEVRVLANEGLHEETTISREDAEMSRSFALTYLRYAFELPGDVAERRAPKTGNLKLEGEVVDAKVDSQAPHGNG